MLLHLGAHYLKLQVRFNWYVNERNTYALHLCIVMCECNIRFHNLQAQKQACCRSAQSYRVKQPLGLCITCQVPVTLWRAISGTFVVIINKYFVHFCGSKSGEGGFKCNLVWPLVYLKEPTSFCLKAYIMTGECFRVLQCCWFQLAVVY